MMTVEEDEIRLCLGNLTCGCMDDDYLPALMQLLRSIKEWSDANQAGKTTTPFPERFSPPLPPPPWTYSPLNTLDHAELIEHGVAIRVPWVTSKGEAVLRFLEKYGDDEDEWDQHAYTGPWPKPESTKQ